jgi:hypothetical protein
MMMHGLIMVEKVHDGKGDDEDSLFKYKHHMI